MVAAVAVTAAVAAGWVAGSVGDSRSVTGVVRPVPHLLSQTSFNWADGFAALFPAELPEYRVQPDQQC